MVQQKQADLEELEEHSLGLTGGWEQKPDAAVESSIAKYVQQDNDFKSPQPSLSSVRTTSLADRPQIHYTRKAFITYPRFPARTIYQHSANAMHVIAAGRQSTGAKATVLGECGQDKSRAMLRWQGTRRTLREDAALRLTILRCVRATSLAASS